jgi:predicted dehydrogenase
VELAAVKKILVLGFGSMGRRHAMNARNYGYDVSIYDPLHQNDSVPFLWFTDERAAFDSRPDAIVIASPALQHADHFWRACACTDGPVFIEKPIALSVDDFWQGTPEHERIHQRVTNRVQVGYNLRFHRGVRYLNWLAGSGALGTITAARAVCSVDRATWPGKTYTDFLGEASHELDLLQYLLGEFEVRDAHFNGVGDGMAAWQLALERGDGVIASVHLDGLRHGGYERYTEIIGTKATAQWRWRDPATGSSEVVVWPDESGFSTFAHTTGEATYRAEMDVFLHGDPLSEACGLFDALSALRLADAARTMAADPLY